MREKRIYGNGKKSMGNIKGVRKKNMSETKGEIEGKVRNENHSKLISIFRLTKRR